MPQMEVVPFKQMSNVQMLNYIRNEVAGTDYQNRVPLATQANIDSTINSMWNYAPTRNQFIDGLVNKFGGQILHNNIWSNPLAKFKRGKLEYGETLEEVAVGLLKAKAYNPDADYLEQEIFGRESNNVSSRWHKVNRMDRYKLTINRELLRRAFTTANGLQGFLGTLLETPTTSDNWDEFLLTTNLFKEYYDNNGFFKIKIGDLSKPSSTAEDARYALRQMRELADTLPFLSEEYNAAKMPMAARPENLELFITPGAKATIDVEGLAAAFNIDKANINTRTTVLPQKYVNIPGFQALLTTKEFFIILDQLIDTEVMANPAGLYTNYWFHHHQLISASPFVPAVMFSSEEETPITVINYIVTGLTGFTVTELGTNAAVTNSTVNRGEAYVVATSANTISEGGVAGPAAAVNLSIIGAQSGRTRISQQGVLIVGYDDPATTITVHAEASDDESFTNDIVLTLAGALVQGSIGQNVDDNTAAIANLVVPRIDADEASVGDTLAVDNGKWDTKGLTYTRQWRANGTAISGATGTTYVVQAGDAGKTIDVAFVASKTGLTSSPSTISTTATISA